MSHQHNDHYGKTEITKREIASRLGGALSIKNSASIVLPTGKPQTMYPEPYSHNIRKPLNLKPHTEQPAAHAPKKRIGAVYTGQVGHQESPPPYYNIPKEENTVHLELPLHVNTHQVPTQKVGTKKCDGYDYCWKVLIILSLFLIFYLWFFYIPYSSMDKYMLNHEAIHTELENTIHTTNNDTLLRLQQELIMYQQLLQELDLRTKGGIVNLSEVATFEEKTSEDHTEWVVPLLIDKQTNYTYYYGSVPFIWHLDTSQSISSTARFANLDIEGHSTSIRVDICCKFGVNNQKGNVHFCFSEGDISPIELLVSSVPFVSKPSLSPYNKQKPVLPNKNGRKVKIDSPPLEETSDESLVSQPTRLKNGDDVLYVAVRWIDDKPTSSALYNPHETEAKYPLLCTTEFIIFVYEFVT